MIDKMEDVVIEAEPLREKNPQGLRLPNVMNLVMIFCIIVAGLLFVGEIKLTFDSVLNVSLMIAIIFLIASIAYQNNYQNGMYAAMKDSEYVKAKENYEKAKSEIYSLGFAPKLSDYCVRYIENELKKHRSAILSSMCVSYEEYQQDYLGKTYSELLSMGVPKNKAQCINRANKAVGIRLNESLLLEPGANSSVTRGLGLSSVEQRNADFAMNIAFRVLTTLLSGTVVIDVIINPSWQALAQWVLRMMAVFWAAVTGYNAGYKNISETTISYLSRKTEILKIFILWHENEKEQGA